MIRFLTLGTAELSGDAGSQVDRALISQPKRLALLTYMTVARPGSRHLRDSLIALFWPEFDEARARLALRRTLCHLRRELGSHVVLGADCADVGIDSAQLWCDAIVFEQEVAADRLSTAMLLYRGEFMAGFHSRCGSAYDVWLDAKRQTLRLKAEDAVCTLMDRAEARGDLLEASAWGARLVALEPYSERANQRLIRLLGATGRRVEALRTYDAFASCLKREEGLAPDQSTAHLAAAIRSGEAISSQ